jgi:hypothetical protein
MKTPLVQVLAVAVMAMSFLSPVDAQDGVITGKEVQEQWVGKSLIGSTPAGVPATVRLLADGSASISSGATTLDTGTWRAWDKGYCTTWSTIRRGEERCFTLQRSGARITVLNPDGSVSGYFSEIK